MRKALIVAIAVLVPIMSSEAVARGYGLICGKVAARSAGLNINHTNANGRRCNLALALEWSRCFPHVSIQAGAYLVQTRRGGGHVSHIITVTGTCTAVVEDEKGRYERDTCKRRVAVVQPHVGFASLPSPGDQHDKESILSR